MKESCPLNCKCLHQCIVYKAKVTTITRYKEYYGTSEGVFKSRYNIIRNLSDTYPTLMIQDYLTTFGRLKQTGLITD